MEIVAEHIAVTIAEKVWNKLGTKDIRDVIKIGRLVNDVEDISLVVKIIKDKR